MSVEFEETSILLTLSFPLITGVIPAIAFKSVVFPEPFGPVTKTKKLLSLEISNVESQIAGKLSIATTTFSLII